MATVQSVLPKIVMIGTQAWEIVEHKRRHDSELTDGSYGYTIDRDNVIVLDNEMSIGMKRVTLFHELLHAIRFIYGGTFRPKKDTTFEEWEHYWVGLYEEPIMLMMRNNPELMAFLLDTK